MTRLPARSAIAVFGCVLTLIVSGAHHVGAQVEMSAAAPPIGALLRGQIVDSVSGAPIAGVLLRMDTGEEVFSDSRGHFRLGDLEQGRRSFALLTSDCRVKWGEITVVNGIPRDVRLRLAPAFAAASEEAAEEAVERKRTSGRRLTIEEIDGSHANSVMELIRRIAPNMVSPMTGDVGDVSALIAGRNRSFVDVAPPVIVIDGVRTPGAEGTLSTMRPAEIAELEVLPGAAAGWEYGSSGAAGVIKIKLRRGVADGAPEARPTLACTVPGFPGR